VLLAIDHVLLAVADPDGAAAELEGLLGLRAAAGGRHDAHGTFNRLLWLGDSYIELMGVFDPALATESWWGRHALAVIGGGGGFMGIAFATDDIEADGSGFDRIEAGQRVRADGRVVRWTLAHTDRPDPELRLAFLIEHDATGAEWSPSERAARAGDVHPLGTPASLMRVELPVSNVRDVTLRLLRDLRIQFRPSLAGGGARDSSIGAQTLRLLRSRGGLLPKVVIRAGHERRGVSGLGIDWQLEPVAAV
jgi:hypothetical protein